MNKNDEARGAGKGKKGKDAKGSGKTGNDDTGRGKGGGKKDPKGEWQKKEK